MTTSIYDTINVGPPERKKREPGEYVALPAGNYGTGTEPALKVVKYVGSKTAKADESLTNYNYVVTSADPSVDGTAFLRLSFKDRWLTPEFVALAFNKVAEYVEAGHADAQGISLLLGLLKEEAENKAIANNTPTEDLETATKTAVDNQLIQGRIQIGQLFRLQDWKGVPRSTGFIPEHLVGVRFSASLEPGFGSGGSTEVKTVFSRK